MAKEKKKRHVLVGKDWPDDLEVLSVEDVTVEERKDSRTKIVIWMAVFIAVLLAAFTAYGMAKGDQGTLDKVWTIIDRAVYLIAGWIGGRFIGK